MNRLFQRSFRSLLLLLSLASLYQSAYPQNNYDPDYLIAVDLETRKDLVKALTNFGSNFTLSLKDIPPIEIILGKRTYEQFIGLGKFFVASGFTLLGGFIIKQGCQKIGEKEKDTAAYKQIIAGIIVSLIGIGCMYLQEKNPIKLPA